MGNGVEKVEVWFLKRILAMTEMTDLVGMGLFFLGGGGGMDIVEWDITDGWRWDQLLYMGYGWTHVGLSSTGLLKQASYLNSYPVYLM